MNTIILSNIKKQSCLNRARLKMGLTMRNEAKRTESVRKGAMPCPYIRGHGIRKREAPLAKRFAQFSLKHVYEVGMRKYGKTNRM